MRPRLCPGRFQGAALSRAWGNWQNGRQGTPTPSPSPSAQMGTRGPRERAAQQGGCRAPAPVQVAELTHGDPRKRSPRQLGLQPPACLLGWGGRDSVPTPVPRGGQQAGAPDLGRTRDLAGDPGESRRVGRGHSWAPQRQGPAPSPTPWGPRSRLILGRVEEAAYLGRPAQDTHPAGLSLAWAQRPCPRPEPWRERSMGSCSGRERPRGDRRLGP